MEGRGRGRQKRERKKRGIRWRHRFIGTDPTANSINRKTFVCSRHPRIHKAQPRMSLYVGISTHASTQHAHCVYTRDNSKSRRQRRINSRQGWIYLSWHLQIPDPFVDTVNTSYPFQTTSIRSNRFNLFSTIIIHEYWGISRDRFIYIYIYKLIRNRNSV